VTAFFVCLSLSVRSILIAHLRKYAAYLFLCESEESVLLIVRCYCTKNIKVLTVCTDSLIRVKVHENNQKF